MLVRFKWPARASHPQCPESGHTFSGSKVAASHQDFRDEDFVAVGDMLVVRTNGSKDLVGRAAIITTPPEKKCSFASYLIRFRLVGDEAFLPWISFAWDSGILRSKIESRAVTTAGQYNVSLSRLADLAIPLPPTNEIAEIVRQADRRLSAADALAAQLQRQIDRAHETRHSLLREAFSGRLTPQDRTNEPASILLDRIRSQRTQIEAERRQAGRRARPALTKKVDSMAQELLSPEFLSAAWERTNRTVDAHRLFDEAGLGPDHLVQFYETLRATPQMRDAFQKAASSKRHAQKPTRSVTVKHRVPKGRFRLIELWLEDFKNLKDYTVRLILPTDWT